MPEHSPLPKPPEPLQKKHLCLCFRIAGDTALNKNIHESVSAQIRKNFAKSKWRVSPVLIRLPVSLITHLPCSLSIFFFLRVTLTAFDEKPPEHPNNFANLNQ